MKSRSIKVSIISVVFFLILVMAYDLKVSAMTNLEIQNQQLISSTGVNPLIITDFKAFTVSSENAGNFIILKTSSIGGVGKLRTRFTAFDGISWTTIKDYSTQSYAIWKPTKAGRYIFFLQIKDSSGVVVKKSIEYEITNPLMIKSLIFGATSPQTIGKSITLSSFASGGKGTKQTKFLVSDGTTWTVIQDFSIKSTATWIPIKAGNYTICTQVKDSTGKVVKKTLNYLVTDPLTIKSFQSGKVSPQILGNAITLNSISSGGIGVVQTKFYVSDGTTTTIIKDYSTEASTTWIPSKAGTYTLYVQVKDATGKIETKSMTYVIANPLTIEIFKAGKVSPQNVGTLIILKTEASGGIGILQSKFTVFDGTTLTTLKDYTMQGYVIWKPSKVGTYTINVQVKDITGKIETKSMAYVIAEPLVINSFITGVTSPQILGNSITLSRTTSGGIGTVQTRFTAFDGARWIIIKDYSIVASALWTPTNAGNYTIWADVKDGSGKVVSKSISYQIIDKKEITISSLTANIASPQNVGTSIILKTEASGGNGILQSKFTLSDGTNTSILKDYSTINNTTWTPTKAGTYKVLVEVKDAIGQTTSKSIEYIIINPLTVNTLIVDKISPQVMGTTIQLSTTMSGGIGTLQSKFVISDGVTDTIIKDYSTQNNTLWTPSKAGKYTVYAYVKDTRGMEISKTLSYKVINPLVINSLTTNKVSPQKMGTAITIQSSAIGNGTLQYKYEIEKDGIRTLLKDYSTISTAVWTPNQTGSYKIIASLKDATGLIVTKEISYLVNINISQLYNMTSSLGWIYFINYNGKDLYDYSENGVRCAGLAINSSNFAVTLMKSTTKSTAIIKQTLSLALPTQYTKVYNIISAPCVDQTLTLDGKTVKIYKSNGYTVAQVCW